jgi:hypothetical protein
MNKGKPGLVGVAAIVALVLAVTLTTGVLAQGMGPGRRGSGMMGGGQDIGPRMMQGSVITPTVPLAPVQGGCGYGPQGQVGSFGPGMMGMMQGNGGFGRSLGMMGGITGMMRGLGMMDGQGMMGADDGEPGVDPGPAPERLNAAEVAKAVDVYLAQNYNNADLEVVELMEFEQNFYAQVAEKSTAINAFELLIDPYTGAVWPEYGPNMMWNTKYGHMSGMGGMMMRGWGGKGIGEPTADMPVDLDQARKNAQAYLDARKSGLTIEDGTDVFYGYYTVHTLDKAGDTVGMLSVNGYTGRVWYHTWHGKFIGMADDM